jgi:hypothetical protein
VFNVWETRRCEAEERGRAVATAETRDSAEQLDVAVFVETVLLFPVCNTITYILPRPWRHPSTSTHDPLRLPHYLGRPFLGIKRPHVSALREWVVPCPSESRL